MNKSRDVKAIAAYLLGKGNIKNFTSMDVLDYLKKNVVDDQREVEVKKKLFT